MSTSTIIRALWDATRVEALTDEQLKSIASSETVSHELENLAGVMSGIGCLVASDTSAGNFQSRHDVPELLFTFSAFIEAAAEAVFVSSDAAATLRNRLEERLRAMQAAG